MTDDLSPRKFFAGHLRALTQLGALTKNSFLAAGLSYVLTILLANSLGPEQFGVYSYILILAAISTQVINFSTDITAPVAALKKEDTASSFSAVVSVRVFLFSIVLCISAFLSTYSAIESFGLVALSLAALNLGFIYEVEQRNVRYSYIYMAERLVYVGFGYAIVFLDVVSLWAIFSIAISVTSLSLAYQAHNNFAIVHKLRLSSVFAIETIKENVFLVLISLSTFAYGGFSRMILEHRLGVSKLGIYSAGWQIVLAGTIFQAQVSRIFRLQITKALLKKDRAELSIQLKRYFVFSTIPSIFIGFCTFVLADDIVFAIFKPEFHEVSMTVRALAVYFAVINLDGLASILWTAIGNRVEYFAITIASSFILLAGLSILPGDAELVTFAITVVIVHGLSAACLLWRVYKKYIARWPSLRLDTP